MGDHLQERIHRDARRVSSKGSRENLERLAWGEIDWAIVQSSSLSLEQVGVLAPLYQEPVHLIVRAGRGMAGLKDLRGRNVAIGPVGSGMRESAQQLLKHFHVSLDVPRGNDRYFLELVQDESLDAAIVTTGIENPDLERVLDTGVFKLLPVDNATALAARHPFFLRTEIPRGLYGRDPPVPAQNVTTVATTALLVTRPDVASLLVGEVLAALHTPPVAWQVPSLIPQSEATRWPLLPLIQPPAVSTARRKASGCWPT